MEDSHALVQAYANVATTLGGLSRIKSGLKWTDRKLYSAYMKLRRDATRLGLFIEAELDELSDPPRLIGLRIYPQNELRHRYLFLR